MHAFHHTAVSDGPPEEVWKLLHDPDRFPEWWAGIAVVETQRRAGEPVGFTYWSEAARDVPMPQGFERSATEHRIVVSCLVDDYRFDWRLAEEDDGLRTRIDVDVEVPEAKSAYFDALKDGIGRSIERLAALAGAD
jgi:uncharacterized protein YndB with AHSA1/START domain